MKPVIHIVVSEVSDNWPAFVYIGLTIVFSICFLRERRAETEALRRIGASLHERIDRVERLIKHHLDG
jgi:hypothetical protein